MIVSRLNLRKNRKTKYIISIHAKAPYENEWKEFYVGRIDEGYDSWPYPVEIIDQSTGYDTIENAKDIWFENISTRLVNQNLNWKFDLSSANIKKIAVSDTVFIYKD